MCRENLMKHLKKLGLATALTMAATSGMVSTASATTVEPANSEVTLVSTNTTFTVDPEGAPITCSSSIVTGDTGPLTHTTWASAVKKTTVTVSGCTALSGFLVASVTSSEGCQTPAGTPIVHAMGVSVTTALAVITLPAICSFDIALPSIGCTLTITGGQTIGNGTAGVGGIRWTNLNPKSSIDFNSVTVAQTDSNGVGFGCPAAGVHTGTLSGILNLTSPTNVTVTP
jgi:hypothetical protein